jgi:hypothetical protein
MESEKPKQKLTIKEYRERSKSKSPGKPEDDLSKAIEKGLESRGDKQVSEIAMLANASIRDERAMSIDEVADVSIDLANMSIDQTDFFLDEKSGELVGNKKEKEIGVVEEQGSQKPTNKLKLKKSVSLTKATENDVRKMRSEKSDSSLTLKAENKSNAPHVNDNNGKFDLSLSERVRIKSGGSQTVTEKDIKSGISEKINQPGTIKPVSKEKVVTGSPEIIDLTSDEESPVPVKSATHGLVHTETKNQDKKKPDNVGEMFGMGMKQQLQSFQSLNKQPAPDVISVPQNSQQWTQARDSAQSHCFKPGTAQLEQQVKADIARRNELSRLLEKQKVKNYIYRKTFYFSFFCSRFVVIYRFLITVLITFIKTKLPSTKKLTMNYK